jgi:hypothetical protein
MQGSLFVGRILTVVTSLRRQQRHVLDYLSQACRAQRQDCLLLFTAHFSPANSFAFPNPCTDT